MKEQMELFVYSRSSATAGKNLQDHKQLTSNLTGDYNSSNNPSALFTNTDLTEKRASVNSFNSTRDKRKMSRRNRLSSEAPLEPPPFVYIIPTPRKPEQKI
ncbi:hypothetical protein HNY73_009245 [Argiope bruennichi]|uniref:Uncharacterized protein n=1 Tax=Argiope bruennichi TaxID=94029 RepID=A0A8T0FEF8_ARGBR|nr:hypothetical protein HNY73_009245 [Argiope bruennichi]